MSSRLLHLIYSMAGSWWRALAWRLPAMVWRGSAKLWGPMSTCLADVVNGGAWGAVIALPLARLRSLLPWLQKWLKPVFQLTCRISSMTHTNLDSHTNPDSPQHQFCKSLISNMAFRYTPSVLMTF
nr:MAG TPA: hypothetical protein [Inoviridae sp.]